MIGSFQHLMLCGRSVVYQLDEDPWELSNLIDAPSHAARVADLSKRPDQWMEETKDPQQVFGTPKKIAAFGRLNIITVFFDDLGTSRELNEAP